jgi:hypothetical protein
MTNRAMKLPKSMKRRPSLFRTGVWTLAIAAGSIGQAVQACPGCKQAGTEGGKVALNGTSVAFSLGVLFMLLTVFAVLGGLAWMMYRSCRILAAQQQSYLAEDENGGAGLSLSAAQPA